MDKKRENEELMYECIICHFILKQKKGDAPPGYCPNCAINHQKGEMVVLAHAWKPLKGE
jgi:rubrerythrin